MEIADRNITVNSIAPGPIQTNMISNSLNENIDYIVSRQIIKKTMDPEDVWPIIKFLLSEDSKNITGQSFNLGGLN